jgi:putative membrane protein
MNTAIDGTNLANKVSGDLDYRLLQFKDVIGKLSEKLQLINNNDLVQIITILQSNPTFMGDFISDPINLKDEAINAIPNYGSAMAPIYTVLALWVGCLLLTSLLKTKVAPFEGSEKLTLREKHFGKMLTFITLAAIQGFIVSVGDKLLLNVYTVNTPLMLIFGVLSSIVFAIITYTLVSILGNIGKAVAIVFMIIQLAGSGGTYPIQVDPMIFRILQPLFPFTYSVGGFREAIAGPLISSVVLDFTVLLIIAAIFILIGFFFKEPLHNPIHRFEERFEESGIGE